MLKFKTAEAGDLTAVLDTCQLCIHELQRQGIQQWDEHYPNANRFANDIASGNLFVVELEGVAAALTVLNTQSDPEYAVVAWRGSDRSAGVVHRLMVRPQFQRRGLARWMMEQVESEARRRGHSSIRLDAYAQNPAALALYDALGYVAVGTIDLRRGAFRCYEKLLGESDEVGNKG